MGDIVLHFHGGGYTLGDDRPADCGFAASTILEHTPASVTHVFCSQYRLSSTPGNRFPAAFQDALASYLYLLRGLDIPANRVVLSGDSAGGHMVIQLLRYLHEFGLELGVEPPRAAWLWSPWCDAATPIRDPTVVYRIPQYPTDFLPSHHLVEWLAALYTPHPCTNVAVDDPYVSPLGNPFRLVCPVWAMIGGLELNVGEVTKWCEEMRGVEGDSGMVELWVEENAVHDVIKCGGILGFEESVERGVERARGFTWGV
ncbi:alpha/beta-hydrolase [Trematosphaeria pertusa]|uniref:Alpha/beta-hydrolase n=1 Tax=Trematosphaeria pertusa TaxID=390896 RepID=A0A6A6J443_9PLEO|nr:alpha/beta-hydrolase [Trematosphaeria pertusa]KAF2256982.1 alpha/beta-hydrolase [Trematosphaeria pertusa]